MPLAGVNRIVIDLEWRAEGQSSIGAARKHDVGRGPPGRLHAGQHVNVIVSGPAGTIKSQEQLAIQSCRIDTAAGEHATHVDWRYLVERWCLIPDLRVARTNAIKHIVKITFAADEEIPIRVHVEGSQI